MTRPIEHARMNFSSQQLHKILLLSVGLSFLFSLKNLFQPLTGDEVEYRELAENLLTQGRYFLYGQPSTYAPLVPFLIGFCAIKSFPAVGYAFAKLLNWVFVLGGLYFANQTLKYTGIETRVRYILLLLTATNTHLVVWSSMLYPEALLIGLVWLFLFLVARAIEAPRSLNYFNLALVFSFMVIGKYVYAVFGVFLVWVLWEDIRANGRLFWEKRLLARRVLMGLAGLLPLLFWVKYISSIELAHTLSDSYFQRFSGGSFWSRIQMGLGLVPMDNGRFNGIPALISLFIPQTGLREWFSSIAILVAVLGGLFTVQAKKADNLLRFALLLLMLGLVYAATGFSRYWMPLLPVFWLGIYYLYRKFKLADTYFIYFGISFSLVYLLNALRLNIQHYLPLFS
ncbi:MAG: hypothetical protein RL386_471 [Bacteroidota bacterium]